MQAQIAAELALAEQNRPTPEEIEARNHELAKNARCKMFYVYRPITVSELKVGGALYNKERQLYKFRICSVHHFKKSMYFDEKKYICMVSQISL